MNVGWNPIAVGGIVAAVCIVIALLIFLLVWRIARYLEEGVPIEVVPLIVAPTHIVMHGKEDDMVDAAAYATHALKTQRLPVTESTRESVKRQQELYAKNTSAAFDELHGKQR